MKKSQPKRLEFSKALKSFLGYLEGTEKAAHTIKSYKLDLKAFQLFLTQRSQTNSQTQSIDCSELSETDLKSYGDFLGSLGHKTNTRRRKLLTAHRFVRYLSQRKQLLQELPKKLPAPHKMERVPYVVSQEELIQSIRAIPEGHVLDRRNRALLWVLAETGCQVSEIGQLKMDSWTQREGKFYLSVPGKAPRDLPVSAALITELESFGELVPNSRHGSRRWLFLGFNKHGSLGAPISARGVELLVRHYSAKLNLPKLTPRTFRHSAVMGWFKQGHTQEEIQKRLGLKTAYAFRSYAPILNAIASNPRHSPHPLAE